MWEETIILLPDNVHYVFLSATIPNARQFAEWIAHLHKQVKLFPLRSVHVHVNTIGKVSSLFFACISV